MKSVITALFLVIAISQPASASSELLRTFASCAGRLTAQIDVEGILQQRAPQRVIAARSAILDILDVVVTPANAREAYDHRIWSRMAQAALLTRAQKESSEGQSWAQQRAAAEVAACEALVLS